MLRYSQSSVLPVPIRAGVGLPPALRLLYSTAACRSTIDSTSRRSATNAMRIPISRVRDVTLQETTP